MLSLSSYDKIIILKMKEKNINSELEHAPCPFCEIIDGKIDASIIRREEGSIAFMDHNGYPLVVTSKHIVDINSDDFKKSKAMELVTSIVGPTLKSYDGATGIELKINLGKPKQEILHLHIHIIPTYVDSQKRPKFIFKLSKEVLDDRALRIKTEYDLINQIPRSG